MLDHSVIASSLPICTVISIANGREFRFGPEWPCAEARVVFDSNSGDYWTVSLLASLVVLHLNEAGPATVRDLQQILAPMRLYANLPAALGLTIQSLLDNKLLVADS